MSFSSYPPAEGVRVHWQELLSGVRNALQERLGARVVLATTQPKGFSPGLAARLTLDDGRRVFLKAVSASANPDSHDIHRREARILEALPPNAPAPRLLWTYDEGGWVALCLEDVDGRHPDEPWTERDLALVISCVKSMAGVLTPSPIHVEQTAPQGFERVINGWGEALQRREDGLDSWSQRNLSRLAELEQHAPVASEGNTLLHFDLRADNLLIAGDRVYVVDWPWARTGAWWVDAVCMAPSVSMQGGPDPEVFMRRFDISNIRAADMDAVICSLAGYFVVRGLEPPPPGLPTVRAFQAAQGEVAVAWLRERTGWS